MPSIPCPHCDATVHVRRDDFGRKVRCPECDARFRVPDDEDDGEAASPPEKPPESATLGSWAGCVVAGVVIAGCCGGIGSCISGDPRKDLAEADKLYAAGSRAEAVAKYKSSYRSAAQGRADVLQRIVDFDAAQGNSDEAKKWINTALDDRVAVAFESQASNALLTQVVKDRADIDRAKRDAAAQKEQKADLETPKRLALEAVRSKATDAGFHVGFVTDVRQEADGRWGVFGDMKKRKQKATWAVYFNRSPTPGNPNKSVWTLLVVEIGNQEFFPDD